MEKIWTNGGTKLFILDNGRPRPLWLTGINEIVWDTDHHFACPRCGSIVSREHKHYEGTCHHCGFTAIEIIESIGNALVTFEGMLPKCLDLIKLSKQMIIEVLHSECGPPDMYASEEVFLRFSDCKIVSQSMVHPVIIGQEGVFEEILTILVKVKCVAEFIQGGD